MPDASNVHVLDAIGRQHDIDDWPEPISILRRGPNAPPLAASDVPPAIGQYAALFAAAGGFDPTATISAGVTIAAAAIDDDIRILLPGASGNFQSARTWTAGIGSSGGGKTPSQKAMRAPVHELHREGVEETQRLRREAEAAGKSDDPRIPQRAVFTSDTTVEKLADLLVDNPRGLLYAVDEFDSWLGSHDAYSRDGGSRARGEWMRLYDGGPHQVDRVARGSFYVKNWGVSILTATTPAALARLSRKLSADGLFARFMVWAIRPMVERDRSISSSTVDLSRRIYEERIRALYAHRADVYSPSIVRLAPDAIPLYEAEESRLRTLVEAAEAVSEGFAAHVAKHPGMLARIALTFHAASDELIADNGTVRHPCAANVSRDTMALAIRYLRHAYRHAWAIYGDCLAGGTPLELAQAMARTILADSLGSFNRRDITHRCRAWRGESERLREDALQALEDFGWIEPKVAMSAGHGARWIVNPKVHERFIDQREEALRRRDVTRSAIRGDTE